MHDKALVNQRQEHAKFCFNLWHQTCRHTHEHLDLSHEDANTRFRIRRWWIFRSWLCDAHAWQGDSHAWQLTHCHAHVWQCDSHAWELTHMPENRHTMPDKCDSQLTNMLDNYNWRKHAWKGTDMSYRWRIGEAHAGQVKHMLDVNVFTLVMNMFSVEILSRWMGSL